MGYLIYSFSCVLTNYKDKGVVSMQFLTSRFGEIEIDEKQVFHFHNGLPGFEDRHRFILIHPDEDLPFSFMQSLDDSDLAFLIADPFLYHNEYSFDLNEETKLEMDIQQEEDVMVFAIVSVNGAANELTMNLLAPIILNLRIQKGKQAILHGTSYRTKHVIQVTQNPAEKGV